MTTSDKPADRYPNSAGPFAGPGNTFPLTDAGRVRNAWARIHQAKVIANHSAAEIADIKAKIRARAKQLGIVLKEHDDAPTDTDSVSSLERAFTPGRIELRSGGSGRTIFGYGAIFGELSRRMQFGYQQVSRSAFDHSYAEGWPDVVCRAEHDPRMLLGATGSGTLRLEVDQRGLRYECDLAPSRQDVLESCARGDYAGSSWAFTCLSDQFEFRDGNPVRNLLSCKVIDVAPVTVPAYSTGAPGLRSLARHMDASYAEVANLAAQGELRRLFERTDRPTLTGAEALTIVQSRRRPKPGRSRATKGWGYEHEYLARLRILRLHAQRIGGGW